MIRAAAMLLAIPLGLDLYLPVPEENPLTIEKIEIGRRLFNDRRLSRDYSIACSSCHRPELAFTDGRPVAVGVGGRPGKRSSPALINRGYGRMFFWDGRERTLEAQVLLPIADPSEMDLPLSEATQRVRMSLDSIRWALASYVRSILAGNSAYDRYVDGDSGALTTSQKRGLRVFRGQGHCTACHVGPTFTDEQVHNTGIAWRTGTLVDAGAGRGRFKTPTLREVSRSAPYMHDGSVATLEDVVEFYDRGGLSNPWLDPEVRPLGLTAEDKRDLVAFLRALTGDIVDGGAVMPSTRSSRGE